MPRQTLCKFVKRMTALFRSQPDTRFRTDERGGVVLIFAFAVIPLIGFIGAAIDYSETNRARTHVVNALDAATLSTARDLSFGIVTEAEARNVLIEHYHRALELSPMMPRRTTMDPEIQIDEANGLVTAIAETTVDMSFMKLMGVNSLDVGVKATASYAVKKFEIALVVDVTGSMSWRTGGWNTPRKIDELRNAVEHDFLNILFEDDSLANSDRVRVSLVPYNQGVLMGDTPARALAPLGNACIAETGSDSLSDATHGGTNLYGYGGYCLSGAKLVPMTNKPADILSVMDTIVSNITSTGATAGHIGLQWGWNTISERWSNQWPADARPSADDAENVEKIVVFMTDGVFNIYNRKRSERTRNGVRIANLRQYHRGNSRDSRTRSESRARSVCDQMKREDIEIYTIGFALPDKKAENILKDCATNSSTFFVAGSGQLGAAFEAIANDIRRVWLSS